MKKLTLLFVSLYLFLGCSSDDRGSQNIDSGVMARSAIVVIAHPLASEVGKQILFNPANECCPLLRQQLKGWQTTIRDREHSRRCRSGKKR